MSEARETEWKRKMEGQKGRREQEKQGRLSLSSSFLLHFVLLVSFPPLIAMCL